MEVMTMTTAETITNLLLVGILATLIACWFRYAHVDSHLRKLPQRLYHLIRNPALRISRARRHLQDYRIERKRRKAREARQLIENKVK